MTPPTTMPESWLSMTEFMAQLARYPAVAGWARIGAGVLAEGLQRGLDQHFRAGQSMQHLIFSTVPHFGLEDELRVTVAWPENDASSAATGARIEVSLGRTNRWFNTPDRLSVAAAADAWPLVAAYLRALWKETQGAPLPDGLLPRAT
jgi:hypothetical protein